MKPFVFNDWHAWDATKGILLSDESIKKLRQFNTTDDCINWLFLNGDKAASLALHKHVKMGHKNGS